MYYDPQYREIGCKGTKKLRDWQNEKMRKRGFYVFLTLIPTFSFSHSALFAANQSFSGAISLYPLPWILMISIWSSSFRCLRSLVI